MLLNADRIEHMPGPRRSCRSWFTRVLLFVRDATSKDLMVSTAAAQKRLTIALSAHPFSKPVAPINQAILRHRRSEACYHAPSAVHAVPYTIPPGLEGDFLCEIMGLRATSGGSGVAENVILPRCRDQA